MAEPVQNFRTAFHGFNREDVVRFLETATARHTAEVNQLQDDVARLERSWLPCGNNKRRRSPGRSWRLCVGKIPV